VHASNRAARVCAHRLGPVKVVPISLDAPLPAVRVEEQYAEVLLIVISDGVVVGEIRVPALSVFSPDLLRRVIARGCGDRLWRRHMAEMFLDAARGVETRAAAEEPTVSVVVCTRDRPDQLRSCLQSLLELEPAADEILVVDNCPSDDATRAICAELPVRYVVEKTPGQARARNRGILETSSELIAFTDDDCVVDSRWLADLGEAFADPLVAAVNGYVGAAELETPAQALFELRGGFDRGLEPKTYHGSTESPARVAGRAGAGANMILRRTAVVRAGLFAEDMGPGTPARAADETYLFYRVLSRGDRVVFDPSRIVWHRHRRDLGALRRIVFDYGVAVSAFAARCVIRHREPAALRVLFWWWGVHLRRQLGQILRRDERRVPLQLFLTEVAGSLAGPWELLRSRRSRRRIPPLVAPKVELAGRARRTMEVHTDAPSLAVVVPTHDRVELLVRVLRGLAAQSYPAERFETVVVLDACTDGSAEAVRSLDLPYDVRVVEHDLRNSAASRNRGVAATEQTVVVFLDDDVVPDGGVLAAHAEAHRTASGDVAVLGDCPPSVEGRSPWELLLRSWWYDHYRRRAEPGHRWTYTDFASANASLARAVLLRHPYDEAFPTRREDWEIGLRLLEAGVRFSHCPHATAWHYLDTSFATALEQRREDGRADVVFAQKHPDARSALPLAAFFWAVDDTWLHREVLRACRRSAQHGRPLVLQAALLRLGAALHLRGRWRRRANRLFRRAYLLGIADALGAPERVAAFAASMFESVETIRVSLDERSPFGLQSLPGAIELELVQNDSVVGRVPAIDPGGQWDWRSVADRVVASVGDDVRRKVVLDALSELGATGPRRLPLREAASGS
jgi:glycosyltransferase involved in cell wall biosynthesis